MTTPRTRSRVSLAGLTAALTVALTVTFALGACATAPSPAPAPTAAPVAVRFDNDASVYVHVYLIGEKREWLLGRVEPGARATLRIPDASLLESQGTVRLAVLAGDRVTLRAARDARAAMTIAQPTSTMLSQRWTFSQTLQQGQLTSLRLGSAGAEVGRP
jgi:hypothetical protein